MPAVFTPGGDASRPSLESYRAYLKLLVETKLDGDLRRRCDSSDIAQDVLLKAHENIEQWRSKSAHQRELFLRIAGTLFELPDDQRQAFILKRWMDYSVAEVAERMGKTKPGAATQVFADNPAASRNYLPEVP